MLHDLRYSFEVAQKIQKFGFSAKSIAEYNPNFPVKDIAAVSLISMKSLDFILCHSYLSKPQKLVREPLAVFHFLLTFLSFSLSSVASALAFSSVVMSR